MLITLNNATLQADLFAGAVFIRQAIGWDIYAAIVLLLAVAALFTIAGTPQHFDCKRV